MRCVERTSEGGWRIAGTRVSLDSLVLAYREGWTPERIASSFPTVTLEQIHGALAYYLHSQEEVDRYLAGQAVTWNDLRTVSERDHAVLLEKIRSHGTPDQEAADTLEAVAGIQRGLDDFGHGRSRALSDFAAEQQARHGLPAITCGEVQADR